jgi:hypothetical protein
VLLDSSIEICCDPPKRQKNLPTSGKQGTLPPFFGGQETISLRITDARIRAFESINLSGRFCHHANMAAYLSPNCASKRE